MAWHAGKIMENPGQTSPLFGEKMVDINQKLQFFSNDSNKDMQELTWQEMCDVYCCYIVVTPFDFLQSKNIRKKI